MSKTTSTNSTPQHRPANPPGDVTPVTQQEDVEPQTVAKPVEGADQSQQPDAFNGQAPRPGANPNPRHEELRRLMAQRANLPQQ